MTGAPGATAATVLIPTTGERAPLLELALASVQRQTVADLEILVMGDGAGEGTRDLMRRVSAADDRVRFLDHPKDVRRGERHRHAALAGARGRIVTYLCDRDWMLPDHVETMAALLEDADFAHSFIARIPPDGDPEVTVHVDVASPEDRRWILAGWEHENGIPLSFAAHTLEAYRRLPHGWRTTPAGKFTDIHMWEQFLARPWCRAAGGRRPTVLYFPSYLRRGWTVERKRAELARWAEDMARPGAAEAHRARVERIAGAAGPVRERRRTPGPARRMSLGLRRAVRTLRDHILMLRARRRGP